MPCHFYSQTNVLHSSNKVSPKIRKLSVQHHKEENQSKTGFGADRTFTSKPTLYL